MTFSCWQAMVTPKTAAATRAPSALFFMDRSWFEVNTYCLDASRYKNLRPQIEFFTKTNFLPYQFEK
jgi:hypothetical protein